MIKEAIEKGLLERTWRGDKGVEFMRRALFCRDRLLEETLGQLSARLRPPEALRHDIHEGRHHKEHRERRLTTVSAVMETLGWRRSGATSAVRPSTIISMVCPVEAEDDLTSRLVNERVHANIQKDGTFSVVPRMWGGATTPEELKRIAEAALKSCVPYLQYPDPTQVFTVRMALP
jgi:NAD(P)H-nitrite reductase large subunit